MAKNHCWSKFVKKPHISVKHEEKDYNQKDETNMIHKLMTKPPASNKHAPL